MTGFRRTLISMFAICLTAAILTGCSRSPRVAFYTLTSEAKPDPRDAEGPSYSVVVGPVSVPDLYDRPQLVMRVDSNRVEILEAHQWASPLKSEITRIIAKDLTALLRSSRISGYPRNPGPDSDFRVLVDIQLFDMAAGKGVDLEASWSINRSGGAIKNGKTSLHEAVGSTSNDAQVAAFSRALAAVSKDIAEAIRAEKRVTY